jgi:hypothetical protein
MLDCHCVNPVTGLSFSNSRRLVSSRNDFLDCHSHSKKSCLHDLSVVMHGNTMQLHSCVCSNVVSTKFFYATEKLHHHVTKPPV